ncbi:MAG: large-conductance mechanosensitive channel protein MscL [Chlamydiales bacterium]|nr:large-conductance mechanosensitive channel protein MscL [Chlamydiales bacterium]
MSIWEEFRAFAIKGNAIDLAIGVIIGAAFGKIVSTLVSDIIMPPIGLLIGGVDFSNLELSLKPATSTMPAVVIKYGVFINTLVDFTIVAAVIFLTVKGLNALKQSQPTEQPKVRDCPECLMEIPRQAKRCGHCGIAIKD